MARYYGNINLVSYQRSLLYKIEHAQIFSLQKSSLWHHKVFFRITTSKKFVLQRPSLKRSASAQIHFYNNDTTTFYSYKILPVGCLLIVKPIHGQNNHNIAMHRIIETGRWATYFLASLEDPPCRPTPPLHPVKLPYSGRRLGHIVTGKTKQELL